MLYRRILQKKPWSSGRRWLSYSCASQTSLPWTVASEQRTPFWGFSSRACISQHASTSIYSANKLNYLKISYGMKGCGYSSHALADLPIDGIVDVPLAQTGEGIAECELLKWFVQEGDQVEEFQPLCEVQSDKATIEITSRYKGQVSQILHVPGDIVKVGETLLKMVVSESSVPVGSDVCDPDDQGSLLKTTNTGGILSTPAVRDLAKQYGIDINAVSGTGEDGRILREDVIKYALQTGKFEEIPTLNAISAEQVSGREKKFPDVSAAYGRDFEDKKITLRAFQRAMVKSMTLASNIPHFHYVEDINCNEIMDLKSFFQNENSDPDIKHTSLPILIKSLSMALNQYPLLNSTFNEELHEITLKGSHNVGLAMATPHGLVVPNIKRVQSLSILEITKELARLHKLALANKLRPEDISGGTITLSNIGAIGGKFGSPLINVPEVCIIAIGRIKKFPRYGDDGNVHPMSVMTVNVGADHRVLDGATVARFCNEWKQYVEKPELIMLHTR